MNVTFFLELSMFYLFNVLSTVLSTTFQYAEQFIIQTAVTK